MAGLQDNDDQADDHKDLYDTTPLQQQRAFSRKRKRIAFVPQQDDPPAATPAPSRPPSTISDIYLKIVLPRPSGDSPNDSTAYGVVCAAPVTAARNSAAALCPVCTLPLTTPTPTPTALTVGSAAMALTHEATLAHQVCVPHSHPPSALDRDSKGLHYLSSHGWDPDERRGLGTRGNGRLFPVRLKERPARLGVGAEHVAMAAPEKVAKLDAGQARRDATKERGKAERMRQIVYGREDVNAYLGVGI